MVYGNSGFAAERQLMNRVNQARSDARTPLSRDDVGEIVHQVLSSLMGDMTATDLKLYGELEGLARYIQSTRQEISALKPEEIRTSHIPAATDELDAVIGATEAATNVIMDACDTISGLADKLDAESGAILLDCVTRTFEACNFQDVTGQRITKVVRTLRTIEARVDALVEALGEQVSRVERIQEAHPMTAAAAAPAAMNVFQKDDDPDSYLLHGPSLPGQSIDQDEIDRLLASFD